MYEEIYVIEVLNNAKRKEFAELNQINPFQENTKEKFFCKLPLVKKFTVCQCSQDGDYSPSYFFEKNLQKMVV